MSPFLFVLTVALAQEGAVASPAAPQPAPIASAQRAQRAAADAAVECRDVTPTGSNVPKSICATAAEWRRMRRESLEANREMSDRLREAQARR